MVGRRGDGKRVAPVECSRQDEGHAELRREAASKNCVLKSPAAPAPAVKPQPPRKRQAR